MERLEFTGDVGPGRLVDDLGDAMSTLAGPDVDDMGMIQLIAKPVAGTHADRLDRIAKLKGS
jgi:hypothetical protein